MDELTWLEGVISVEAAIRSGNRPIEGVYLRRGKWQREVQQLRQTAVSANIPVHTIDDTFIAERVTGQSHGGVLAQVGARRFLSLEALIAHEPAPVVVMLDGIEDPFNFGQAVRTLYAAGIHGVVVRPRNWLSAAGVVARASAGASEWMPMAVAETAVSAATHYKSHGLTIACLAQEGAVSLFATDLKRPLFLLIGGEKRGITRSFLSQTDLRLQIPYGRPYPQSLGTVASAAVLGFELMRQRMGLVAGG